MQDTTLQEQQTQDVAPGNEPRKASPFLWGALLIGAGVLLLLQNLGIFESVAPLFIALAFAAAGLIFLYFFLARPRDTWWAAIPGFTLLGLGATVFVGEVGPRILAPLAGSVFLGAIGVGFLMVYFARRDFWWALIPAGVMGTLAVVAAIDVTRLGGEMSGSIFFLGLGLTFAVIGLLPNPDGKVQRWALIPAAVLLVMAMVIGTVYASTLNYVWPVVLIIAGGVLVYKAMQSRQLR
jgi:hypothetical protein